MSAPYKKKLIEVALPLEAINEAAYRDSSTLEGHPWNVHYWWARRKLPVCRAVLFAQLVDDPSAHPELFPSEEDQALERKRLFELMERLLIWENLGDEALLREAREQILISTDGNPPLIIDPFAGGGSIPLEAQRLGLETYAADLNPVAVVIGKALVEIPHRWSGQPPVFPGATDARVHWPKATGLAEDVVRYGHWIGEQALSRIGVHYPQAMLSAGDDAKVIAWLWARTITCPNPACGVRMPLVRTWWLSKKKGKEAYVVPSSSHDSEGNPQVTFSIGYDPKDAPRRESDGTVGRSGASCVACGATVALKEVRALAKAGDLGEQMMAVVAEGNRRREYLPPTREHVSAAQVTLPIDLPEGEIAHYPGRSNTREYGLTRFSQLFTPRQLTALTTFAELIDEARERIHQDALKAGLHDDEAGLEQGGTGARAYADSVSVYLAAVLDRAADNWSSLSSWHAGNGQLRNVFARQALPMVWDFAEANPFATASVSWEMLLGRLPQAIARLGTGGQGHVRQAAAQSTDYSHGLVCTDPPYYDNVGYAILSDFFYGWLRRSLCHVFPSLFGTIQTPKSEELVADPYRHGGKSQASDFFEQGFRDVFVKIREGSPPDFPVVVFYAFKQVDSDSSGSASTGWQTLLEGMLSAGWQVTATWPVRTERASRMLASDANALASSIVLALRPRPDGAETINRRGFVQALLAELPDRLREMQQGSIAPVDLAQAAIGPGMGVFSRYARVLEADGSDMVVRTALALINQALDEVLTEQEGDFDAETRFAVKWFSQYGWSEAPSGEADVLSRAVNTTVTTLERGGIFRAAAGKARLIEPAQMSSAWNPAEDKSISVWEIAVRIGHALLTQGAEQAAIWMRESASRVDLHAVKELSYLMYSVAERKGWTDSAMLFNALGTSWSEIAGSARLSASPGVQQGSLEFGDEAD